LKSVEFNENADHMPIKIFVLGSQVMKNNNNKKSFIDKIISFENGLQSFITSLIGWLFLIAAIFIILFLSIKLVKFIWYL
tara:strand:+ start:205 stop:444 length:240 start_codon:yes stop_codon:yes gene_type:complete